MYMDHSRDRPVGPWSHCRMRSAEEVATIPGIGRAGFTFARVVQIEPVDRVVSSRELARPARRDEILSLVRSSVRSWHDLVQRRPRCKDQSVPVPIADPDENEVGSSRPILFNAAP
jgi:hypothetical protein